MALIKQGMCIQCRTEEELEVFIEVAKAEGHNSGVRRSLDGYRGDYPKAFTVGLFASYPRDILNTHIDQEFDDTTNIEASQLFRNQIIARRIRNGTN